MFVGGITAWTYSPYGSYRERLKVKQVPSVPVKCAKNTLLHIKMDDRATRPWIKNSGAETTQSQTSTSWVTARKGKELQ